MSYGLLGSLPLLQPGWMRALGERGGGGGGGGVSVAVGEGFRKGQIKKGGGITLFIKFSLQTH